MVTVVLNKPLIWQAVFNFAANCELVLLSPNLCFFFLPLGWVPGRFWWKPSASEIYEWVGRSADPCYSRWKLLRSTPSHGHGVVLLYYAEPLSIKHDSRALHWQGRCSSIKPINSEAEQTQPSNRADTVTSDNVWKVSIFVCIIYIGAHRSSKECRV